MELKFQNKPDLPTNTKVDSIGIQENRRVEIITTEWDVAKAGIRCWICNGATTC
jgi:hypothetical protein